jgi:formate hydrogenlyase transcriptional activator
MFTDSTRALILRALNATDWVIGGPGGSAARLGLKRTTLIAKMKKLGISRPTRKDDTNQLNEKARELAAVATTAERDFVR